MNVKYSKAIKGRELVKLTSWVTDYLCMDINRMKKIYKLMTARPNDVRLKEYYKSFRNKLKSNLRKAKEEFYLKRFNDCSGNLKDQWKIVNSLIV
jgi:hypothetical protein